MLRLVVPVTKHSEYGIAIEILSLSYNSVYHTIVEQIYPNFTGICCNDRHSFKIPCA